MANGSERFQQRAQQAGIAIDVHEFPAGTRTAADAAAAIGCDVAQIVKSLVFVADDQPVLVLTSGANRVDEGRLAGLLGADEVRKATAEEARSSTGYAIGGTPPFGHDRDLPIRCDRLLTTFSEVWAAAGTPMSVFPIAPELLLEVTNAEVVDISG